MSAVPTPGAYLKMRRRAALLDVQTVAERLQVEPPVAELERVEWLRMIEADTAPASFQTIVALRCIYSFDLHVLAALSLHALGLEGVPEPQICRICGCSEDDACPASCWWLEDDLCSACSARADESTAA